MNYTFTYFLGIFYLYFLFYTYIIDIFCRNTYIYKELVIFIYKLY